MKLAAPLRVTWDWRWPPAVQPDAPPRRFQKKQIRTIGEELARARVLLLEVGYPGAAALREGLLESVMADFTGQVSLVLTPATIAELNGGILPLKDLAIDEVWADVTPLSGNDGDGFPLPRAAEGAVWPDLRVYLTSSNLAAAASVLREAVEGGARRLSLPILPLFGSFLRSAGTPVPLWKDLVEFTDFLEPVFRRYPDLDVRVHHQVLWMLLAERGIGASGSEAPGHTGCQAAAALAYIDPGGILYPCSAFPVPLGRVEKGAIESIWKDEERSQLRKAIEQVPAVCESCGRWQSCRGGCRGWAHFIHGTWHEPGPDCGLETGSPRPDR